jgi:hypothetical protein
MGAPFSDLSRKTDESTPLSAMSNGHVYELNALNY